MQEECKTYENARHKQAVTHAFLTRKNFEKTFDVASWKAISKQAEVVTFLLSIADIKPLLIGFSQRWSIMISSLS